MRFGSPDQLAAGLFLIYLVGTMTTRSGLLLIAVLVITCSALGQAPKRVYKGNESVGTVTFTYAEPTANGVRGVVYVINYSDLITHLALRPEPLPDKPNSKDLNWALEQDINEKLLRHAAGRYLHEHRVRISMAEIDSRSAEMAGSFASPEFEERVKLINGLYPANSVRFAAFIMRRLEIEKYLQLKAIDRQEEIDRLRKEATVAASRVL
jgi:hypothetical protein